MNVTFESQDEGERLDRALARRLPQHSRSFIARLIEDGRVTLEGQAATRPSVRVAAGQVAALDVPRPAPTTAESQEMPLSVIFEDDDLIVIDKPAGLVVHPVRRTRRPNPRERAALSRTRPQRYRRRAAPRHRPPPRQRHQRRDGDRQERRRPSQAERGLGNRSRAERIRGHRLRHAGEATRNDRRPIGRDPRNRKRMAIVAGGRRAITDFEVIEPLRHASVVRCILRTGRTHQIRVHLKSIGHPIIGDPRLLRPAVARHPRQEAAESDCVVRKTGVACGCSRDSSSKDGQADDFLSSVAGGYGWVDCYVAVDGCRVAGLPGCRAPRSRTHRMRPARAAAVRANLASHAFALSGGVSQDQRSHVPLLPPDFRTSWSDSMVMPFSALLHIS